VVTLRLAANDRGSLFDDVEEEEDKKAKRQAKRDEREGKTEAGVGAASKKGSVERVVSEGRLGGSSADRRGRTRPGRSRIMSSIPSASADPICIGCGKQILLAVSLSFRLALCCGLSVGSALAAPRLAHDRHRQLCTTAPFDGVQSFDTFLFGGATIRNGQVWRPRRHQRQRQVRRPMPVATVVLNSDLTLLLSAV
jgi:hypothetical protein